MEAFIFLLMKFTLSILTFFLSISAIWGQPCSTTNGTNCVCPDGTQKCDLLPDLMISWYGIVHDAPIEYSQAGNGIENGRLRINGSIPNIGYGAFNILASDSFVCGTDTIYDPQRALTICPDGSYPTNLLHQRVYQKNGNTVTYYYHYSGGQTYHPGHNHNHVDDWLVLSLRVEDPNEPDTLKWPIIGTSSKVGYCLMDLKPCQATYGECRDQNQYNQGNVLTNTNMPNFGMGSGVYKCSHVEQGISVGYVDVYGKMLQGMWIDIPPGTCNGDYWIVAEIDPKQHFLESNKNNNWTAVPYKLVKQNPNAHINSNNGAYLCNNEPVDLSAAAAQTYLWSTGDTSQNITATAAGVYSVTVSGQCGTAVDTLILSNFSTLPPTVIGDTVCMGNPIILSAIGSGSLAWYSAPSAGFLLGTGNTYILDSLRQTTIVYVQNSDSIPGSTSTCASLRVAVMAAVETLPSLTFNGLAAIYIETDHAVQIYPSIPNGTFTGRGINTDGTGRTYFSPTLAGVKDSIAITYRYTTPAGCNRDTVIYITVRKDPTTSIAELDDNRLLFYPNPTQNTITLTLPPGLASATLSILDATGKTILNAKLANGIPVYTLDISPFAQGLYFLRLEDATGIRFGKLSKL
ncbi:hypothetical protein BH09BAC1_BH09BAC1_00930 [soil metagenome]